MADDAIDLSTLPPLPGETAAPAAAATPAIKVFGKNLPKGYSTKKPVAGAAAPAAATPPAADAAKPEEAPQEGDWTSSLKDVVGGLIPQGVKDVYHEAQEKYGKPAEQAYEKVAKPVTKGVAIGAEDWLLHPQWATAEGQEKMIRDIHTPYEQLPEHARDIAEAIVPQTIPDVAMTATAFAMPEIGAERKLGEAASAFDRLAGNRLARVGAGGLVGGVTGGLTGTGGTAGAIGGATGFAIPELTGKAVESVSRRWGEDSLRRETTAKFGKAITDRLPWLGKIKTGDDFADQFVRGGATTTAGDETRRVKTILRNFFRDRTFIVPEIGEDGSIAARHMTFGEADDLKTKYDRGGFALQGQRRSGITPRQYQDVGLAIRDHLASQMDYNLAGAAQLTPQEKATLKSMGLDISGGVGKAYKDALNKYDVAKELTGVFRNKKGLFHEKYGLNQPELIDRLDKASAGLDRAMGKGQTKDLLDVIKRGFVGEGKDLPSKAGKYNLLKHVVGTLGGGTVGALGGLASGRSGWVMGGLGGTLGGLYGWERGTNMDPAGNVRWSMRPQMDAVESVFANRLRAWMAEPSNQRSDINPALKAANEQRAKDVAGPTATPDRVSLIQGHTETIARGESPNVQADLNRGNLSIGNVRKMLDNSKLGTGVQTAFNGLSPTDAIHAFSQVDRGEQQALLPILIQHIQNSGKNMQPQERQQMLAQLQAAMAGGEVA